MRRRKAPTRSTDVTSPEVSSSWRSRDSRPATGWEMVNVVLLASGDPSATVGSRQPEWRWSRGAIPGSRRRPPGPVHVPPVCDDEGVDPVFFTANHYRYARAEVIGPSFH